MSRLQSGLFIIDRKYRIVSFNDAAKRRWPALERGRQCHEALLGRGQACEGCPAQRGVEGRCDGAAACGATERAVFDLPGIGPCSQLLLGSGGQMAQKHSAAMLTGMVQGLRSAGFVDLDADTITILRDETGRLAVNSVWQYGEFLRGRLESVIEEESKEGLRLAQAEQLRQELAGSGQCVRDFHRKDGMWVRCTWSVLPGCDGDSSQVLLYSADVSAEHQDRKQITALQMDQEAIIQGLGNVYYSVLLVDYQHDHVTVFRYDDEDGRDIAAYFARHGFRWSEGIAQYCEDLVTEESRYALRDALSVERLGSAQEGFSVSYQKKFRDGLRYLEARVTFAQKIGGGRVAVVGTRSVDETVRHEKALRTQLQMIAAAAGTVYPMMAEVNLTRNTYRIVQYAEFVNKTAATEGTLDDFIAVGKSTLPDAQEAEEFERLFCRQNQIDAFRRGERELRLRHRQYGDDGKVHWMDTRVVFVAGEDGDMHEISMSRPIDDEVLLSTRLEQAKEAAEAANRAKSTFLFNMSHDIRTPMNAIVGFTELAQQHICEPERLEDYLKKIRTSSDYLLKLINSVLEMARIEKGKLTLDCEPAELGQVCRDVLGMFEEEAAKRSIRYRCDVGFAPVTGNIDRVRVEEILSNVVSNAIKYSGEGGLVEVKASLEAEKEGRSVLVAVVRDEGIGMSKEFLPQMFDSFARERSEVTAEVQGTGLGMGITRRLLDIMGGSIGVESELGVGTTVTVRIPFAQVLPAERFRETCAGHDSAALLRGRRLLLAEDNELNAEIAQEMLGSAGLLVERAADGVACVSMLVRAEPGYYDAILMDIQMPNLNGHQAAQRIRGLSDPKKAGIPIIAMTANAFEEDRRQAMDSGMNGFVSKPVVMEQLLKELASLLN